jgi:hypothetical protein
MLCNVVLNKAKLFERMNSSHLPLSDSLIFVMTLVAIAVNCDCFLSMDADVFQGRTLVIRLVWNREDMLLLQRVSIVHSKMFGSTTLRGYLLTQGRRRASTSIPT